jgi:hypothetical protein
MPTAIGETKRSSSPEDDGGEVNRLALIRRLAEQHRRSSRAQQLVDADYAAELEQKEPAPASGGNRLTVAVPEPSFDQELEFE